MQLQKQLDALEEIGLGLNNGISIDDLLTSFDECEYENPPFDLLLYMLGAEVEAEPYGRSFCTFAWTFDMSSIAGDGSYTMLAKDLMQLTGNNDLFEIAKDRIDFEKKTAELTYIVQGERVDLAPVVEDNWADPMIVAQTLSLIEALDENVKVFFFKANGDENTFYYLTHAQGERLVALSGGTVRAL